MKTFLEWVWAGFNVSAMFAAVIFPYYLHENALGIAIGVGFGVASLISTVLWTSFANKGERHG